MPLLLSIRNSTALLKAAKQYQILIKAIPLKDGFLVYKIVMLNLFQHPTCKYLFCGVPK
jgi:hypothetical protein